jgi:hypothetical protein
MRRAKCRFIREWINELKNDLFIAVSVENLLRAMNEYLEMMGEEGVVTREAILNCLKRDESIKSIKIVTAKNGKEVLWLWNGRHLDDLINRVIEVAAEEGEV